MPEGYYRPVAWPNRGELWLDQAAAENRLIVCRCKTCKRLVRYLASDLLPLLGADHRVMLDPPYPCRCGEREYISIRVETPSVGDWGSIEVRRPAGIRRTQLWKTVKLGDVVTNTGFGALVEPVVPKVLRGVAAKRQAPNGGNKK